MGVPDYKGSKGVQDHRGCLWLLCHRGQTVLTTVVQGVLDYRGSKCAQNTGVQWGVLAQETFKGGRRYFTESKGGGSDHKSERGCKLGEV